MARPGSFDVIVTTGVLEHLDDSLAALDTCCELLLASGLVPATEDPGVRVLPLDYWLAGLIERVHLWAGLAWGLARWQSDR